MAAADQVLSHHVRAHNAATASDNKIHDDAVARRYGFSGGLVPGITVFGYLTTPIVDAWGEAWLEHGALSARFRKPIYEDDDVSVTGKVLPEATDGELSAELEARNSAGEVCAVGTARLPKDPPVPPALGDAPEGALPATRLEATPEALSGVDVLGSLEAGFHASRTDETLALVGDALPLYGDLAVAHPVWLLSFANTILASNVALGPWIHTASAVQNHSLLHDGERLSARGRVAGLSERRGNHLVDLDVLLVADGARPVMSVRHTAIYRLRPAEHSP
ncbi:MAG: MaoC family dehydratase [Acidimicrobiia bacterium]|nr:MaoC family dehydratase [Acidimicrobiia bacterium]